MSNGNSDQNTMLTRLTPDDVKLEIKDPVDGMALKQAKDIINELRSKDDGNNSKGNVLNSKLLQVAKRLGDISDNESSSSCIIISKAMCKDAYEQLNDKERISLINIHKRIQTFALAQRQSITDMTIDVPGGKAGHTVSPCINAGCYAPGGRYPLPSSVLMTAVTARAAGCQNVILASPKPAPITLAAAYIANVDIFICVGGAQAIAAMAYGVIDDSSDDNDNNKIIIPCCDVICGPGNKWVTAAKSIVNGHCGIDMLAGPSEVLVICDEYANPVIVASDLIAQAEHDIVARAILLCTDINMINQIDNEVYKQIQLLPEPNKSTAYDALKNNSFIVLCNTLEQCIQLSDDIAPEHLEIHVNPSLQQDIANQCNHYGGLFIGQHAAEVLGDYGAGPNHTLPTGGTGRYTGGLSIFHFLRIRTWMRIDTIQNNDCQEMIQDSITMARLEGLEGHARAAEKRVI